MNLTAERLNRGLTVKDLAELLGISRGTITSAEAGDMPRPDNAKKIADFYDVKVTDIWPIEAPSPRPAQEAGATG